MAGPRGALFVIPLRPRRLVLPGVLLAGVPNVASTDSRCTQTSLTVNCTTNVNARRVLTLQNPAQGIFYGGIAQLDDGGTGNYKDIKGAFTLRGSYSTRTNRGRFILTGEATPAAEIDAEAARAEYAEASARRATDATSAAEREKRMTRARARQQVASMR